MKKFIFFVLLFVGIYFHTEIYDSINGPSKVTAQTAENIGVVNSHNDNNVVVGAPHNNGPMQASAGPMGTVTPPVPVEETTSSLTQWLVDHTPKK